LRIIAFGHKARQGKTWAAQFLAERLPGRTLVWGFGDGLKVVARAGYRMGKKDPGLLQKIGEEYRQQEAGIWIRTWEGTISDQEGLDTVIIPDLRHRNEALYLHSRGATLVRVRRLDDQGRPYIATDRDPLHVSETDLDDWPSWDLDLEASSVASLGFALHESFLQGQIRHSGKRTFHLRSGFALGPR
jgi:hypothetical protein